MTIITALQLTVNLSFGIALLAVISAIFFLHKRVALLEGAALTRRAK